MMNFDILTPEEKFDYGSWLYYVQKNLTMAVGFIMFSKVGLIRTGGMNTRN